MFFLLLVYQSSLYLSTKSETCCAIAKPCRVYHLPQTHKSLGGKFAAGKPPAQCWGRCAMGCCQEVDGSSDAHPSTQQAAGLKLTEKAPGSKTFLGWDGCWPQNTSRGCQGKRCPAASPLAEGLHGAQPPCTSPPHNQGTWQGPCLCVLPGHGVLVGQTTTEPLLGTHAHTSTQAAGAMGEAHWGGGSRALTPMGTTSPLPAVPIPHQKGYGSRGCSRPWGEVPEDGIQPSCWPWLLPVPFHCVRAVRELCHQPDPTNTAGEERSPVGVCSFRLSCTCASSRACSERLQKPCREPVRVNWQGLQMGGPAGGWDVRGESSAHAFFCTSLPAFPYFFPSLPAVTELQGFHQPCAESNAWRSWAETTASTDILFISWLSELASTLHKSVWRDFYGSTVTPVWWQSVFPKYLICTERDLGCLQPAWNPHLRQSIVLGGLSAQPSGAALMLLSKKRGKGTKGVTVQHLGSWEGRKKKPGGEDLG